MRALEAAEKLINLANFDTASGGELMTNLKLQKLLYYEQGFHLAIFGTPLFSEEIEAWMYGPVVPVVYDYYKEYGDSPLPTTNKMIELKLPKRESDLFIEVYDTFKVFSAIGLVKKTHSEAPWLNVKVKDRGNVITKKSMKDFFKTKIV